MHYDAQPGISFMKTAVTTAAGELAIEQVYSTCTGGEKWIWERFSNEKKKKNLA